MKKMYVELMYDDIDYWGEHVMLFRVVHNSGRFDGYIQYRLVEIGTPIYARVFKYRFQYAPLKTSQIEGSYTYEVK